MAVPRDLYRDWSEANSRRDSRGVSTKLSLPPWTKAPPQKHSFYTPLLQEEEEESQLDDLVKQVTKVRKQNTCSSKEKSAECPYLDLGSKQPAKGSPKAQKTSENPEVQKKPSHENKSGGGSGLILFLLVIGLVIFFFWYWWRGRASCLPLLPSLPSCPLPQVPAPPAAPVCPSVTDFTSNWEV